MTSTVQRKQGVGLFKPVSWNKGRRFTSPGPDTTGSQFREVDPSSKGVEGYFNSEGPLLRLQIESYLDDHPEFTESYILRKVERNTIDRWLTQNAVVMPEINTPKVSINKDDFMVETPRKISEDYCLRRKSSYYTRNIRNHYSADCTPVMRRSQSVTPHRKISAATFEGGCHSPLLTTAEDGSVSFLTVPPPLWRRHSMRHSTAGTPPTKTRRKKFSADEFFKTRQDIDSQSDNEVSNIPTQLHDNLASDMDLGSLCFKIAKNLCTISKSTSTSVLQVKKSGANHYLSGSAVGVDSQSVDDGNFERPGLNLSTEFSNCLINIIETGEPVSLTKEEMEHKFGTNMCALIIPKSHDYSKITLLPLSDSEHSVQGIVILIHRGDIANKKLVTDVCKLSGICMKNATEFQSMSLEVTRSQMFLDLARVIFDQQTSIEFTVLKILVNFLNLIECERAQILLSSKESPTTFRKVFDLEENDLNKPGFENLRAPYENRFPINSTITGLVATVGETVNIGDVSNDNRFDDNINSDAHFAHRSLLCMPIVDSDQQIVGVVSLINKKNSSCFTANDESFVEAFGIFCGISLANVSNLEVVKAAEARSQVALDIMTYHASSSEEEAAELACQLIPSALSFQLQSFSFTDLEMEDVDTLKASLRMFHDLDLVKRFGLEHRTMCRWILTVKKNYRPEVVYHNWRHAFNVAQVMFSCLINSGWWEGLGPLTCLGLIVACLSHDLDHRGTNNTFLTATNSPLANLYSTSTLERHHLNQALIILNLEGNRLLENMSPDEYSTVLGVVEEAILATDLSLHFQHLGRLLQLAKEGTTGLDWSSPPKVSVVMAALMTASDLGATTKPWNYQREVAGLVAEEFWSQGDLEREKLLTEPAPMMDRELRHELPRLQIGFCESVCLPVYRSLASLSPSLDPLQRAVISNRDRWAELAENNQEGEEETENKVTRNL